MGSNHPLQDFLLLFTLKTILHVIACIFELVVLLQSKCVAYRMPPRCDMMDKYLPKFLHIEDISDPD